MVVVMGRHPRVAWWEPRDTLGSEVAEASRELFEAAGMAVQWVRTVPGEAAEDQVEAGLLAPLGAVDDDTHHQERQVRAAWGGVLTVIERTGTAIRSGLPVSVLLLRMESGLSNSGIELWPDSEGQRVLLEATAAQEGRTLSEYAAVAVHAIDPDHIRVLCREAFEVCCERSVQRITVTHKGNSIKYTDGLFAVVAKQELEKLIGDSGIIQESLIIDHMAAELTRNPQDYRAILTHGAFAELLAALLDGQLDTDAGGVCRTIGTARRPLFGYDVALDPARHTRAPEAEAAGRLRSVLLAGSLLADHLDQGVAAAGIRAAADALDAPATADGHAGTAGLAACARTAHHAVRTAVR